MKWFKHHTSMRNDAKIKRVIRKYGAEGYALYCYILESIAGNLESKSPLPALEETSEDLAFELRMDTLKVQEIVNYCIGQGLFSEDELTGHILCMKMYKFLDDATRKSVEVVKLLDFYRNSDKKTESLGQIPNNSVKVPPDIDLDRDKDLDKDLDKNHVSELAVQTFDWNNFEGKMVSKLISSIQDLDQACKIPTLDKQLNVWASHIDKLKRIDNRTEEQIEYVVDWVSKNNFWKKNIRSTSKLREKFDQLVAQIKSDNKKQNTGHDAIIEHNNKVAHEFITEMLQEAEYEKRQS